MISFGACRACCIRQIKRLAAMLNTDPGPVLKIFNEKIKEKAFETAPEYAELIHKAFNEKTGVDDPYKEIKKHSNVEALRLIPIVEEILKNQLSGLHYLIDLSIAGNMIDYGAFEDVNIEEFIRHALSAPYFKFELDKLEEDLTRAKTILYLADNAGEIIFDMPLLKHLHKKGKKIYLAVRSGPIINDVTYEDAVYAGADKFTEIISTGLRVPGIIISRISKEFKEKLYHTDLVISKGQGNFETLWVEKKKPKNLYYLFVVKCEPVASLIGANVRDKVLMKG